MPRPRLPGLGPGTRPAPRRSPRGRGRGSRRAVPSRVPSSSASHSRGPLCEVGDHAWTEAPFALREGMHGHRHRPAEPDAPPRPPGTPVFLEVSAAPAPAPPLELGEPPAEPPGAAPSPAPAEPAVPDPTPPVPPALMPPAPPPAPPAPPPAWARATEVDRARMAAMRADVVFARMTELLLGGQGLEAPTSLRANATADAPFRMPTAPTVAQGGRRSSGCDQDCTASVSQARAREPRIPVNGSLIISASHQVGSECEHDEGTVPDADILEEACPRCACCALASGCAPERIQHPGAGPSHFGPTRAWKRAGPQSRRPLGRAEAGRVYRCRSGDRHEGKSGSQTESNAACRHVIGRFPNLKGRAAASKTGMPALQFATLAGGSTSQGKPEALSCRAWG